MMKGANFLRFWFPVILYSGIIFYVSSLENLQAPIEGPLSDKIWHVFEYFPYGFLMARALDRHCGQVERYFWLAFILSALYGLSDEVHQLFVVGRFFSWFDILADALGSILGVKAYFYLVKRKRERGL